MHSIRHVLYPVAALALVGSTMCISSPLPSTVLAASPTPTPSQIYLASLISPVSGQTTSGAQPATSNQMIGGAAVVIGPAGPTSTNGQAEGQYLPQNKTGAVVGLQAAGLKPNGTYTAVLAVQACSASVTSGSSTNGSTPENLTVHADAFGDAAIVDQTNYKISPTAKTQLALRQGSGTGTVVACAALHIPAKIVPIKGMSVKSTVSGIAMITPNTPVLNGKVKSGTEVIIYATGLQHSTVQPVHIHAGSCSTSSSILFPLTTLVTDASGRAVSGTGIPYNVTMTSGSIHIHNTSFAMEACGNLSSATSVMTPQATATPSS